MEFINNEELLRELVHKYTPPCSQLTYEADIRIATQRILERRKNIKIVKTVMKEPLIMIEPIESMQNKFCIY